MTTFTVTSHSNQPGLFGNQTRCRIEMLNGSLAVHTPFDMGFVDDLKTQIPYQHRSWEKDKKVWLVSLYYANELVKLIQTNFNETVDIPKMDVKSASIETTIRVDYLGRCKDRDGQNQALGFGENSWKYIFPEKVLRKWFDNLSESEAEQEVEKNTIPKPKTFYQLLGCKTVDSLQEIKTGYRRMARQWHPDVCKETDARERFEEINKAYLILSDTIKRKRYDLGLKLQKKAESQIKSAEKREKDFRLYLSQSYISPLRCGMVKVKGINQVGKILVEEILDWQDITNSNGDVLVSSWDMETQSINQIWIANNRNF